MRSGEGVTVWVAIASDKRSDRRQGIDVASTKREAWESAIDSKFWGVTSAEIDVFSHRLDDDELAWINSEETGRGKAESFMAMHPSLSGRKLEALTREVFRDGIQENFDKRPQAVQSKHKRRA